jgi:mycothiol synthase
MKQLKMMRYSAPVSMRALPDGYRYELFDGSDAAIDDWITICKCGLLPADAGRERFNSSIANYPDLVPEKDLFFVLDRDGKRVATSAAVCHKNGEGYIHMVAALPEYRSKGIGHAMLSHALSVIENRGFSPTVLTTDDFRLAAIKTYLDAGFRPVIYHDPDSDMKARWDTVISQLHYKSVEYINDKNA